MSNITPKFDIEALDRYRTLFESSADAFLIIEQGKFVDCNQAAAEMLGYQEREALLQRHPSELSPEYQPDGQSSLDKANEILANVANYRSQRFEWVHLKANGELIDIEVSMTAIPVEEGYNLHIIWRDISERKRLEKDLRHAQKMEALGTLAAGIAHDFNNTLVPIVTYSDLLARHLEEQPRLQKWAQEIGRAGALAASLVKKLRTVSRKDDRRPLVLNLENAVKNSLSMLQKLVGEDITVHFESQGMPLWVKTDPNDIDHILLNLASNSRDALPMGGQIKIKLRLIQTPDDQNLACLTFTDNGMGMEATTAEQVFVPFYTTKDRTSGTGLGMSSVYELVRLADGDVSIRSRVGQGTIIRVTLPLVDDEEGYAAGTNGETVHNDFESVSLHGTNILVVEDDIDIMRLTCDLLQLEGVSIYKATNGVEALRILESVTLDLILTDVIMPGMSGPQLIEQMSRRGIQIPILFMSGYVDDRLKAHGFDPTAVSFIQKPFTASAFLSQIKHVLSIT